jgi:hypothetical protein
MKFFTTALALLSTGLFLSLYAESYPTTWLQDHVISLRAGEDIEVFAVPELLELDLSRIDWQGGTLRISGCILEGQFGTIASVQLPLTVDSGQTLYLDQVTIQSAETAIEILDGSVFMSDVVLATTAKGVLLQDPVASLEMLNTHVALASVGVDVQAAASVIISDCTFLTNDLGLKQASGSSVDIENTLFQANETALVIEANSAIPGFSGHVDFCDSRTVLIDNKSTNPMNLDGVFIDEVSKLSGPFVGVQPEVPFHLLYLAAPPSIAVEPDEVVAGEIALTCIPAGMTPEGLPCKSHVFEVLHSIAAYGIFTSVGSFPMGDEALIQADGEPAGYYQVRTLLGVWSN